MEDQRQEQERITENGNPAKPVGEDGAAMLERMNKSHYDLTTWALSHWKVEPSDQLLDVGCGGGETVHRLSEQVTTGKVTGIDYSEVSVSESTKRNDEEIQEGKVQILTASVDALPFAKNSFDKIITVESFYFWPDAVKDLQEVLRVLKKGGTFLLVADVYGDANLTEEEKANIKRYRLRNPTREEFRALFEAACFTECQVHTKPGTTWICVEGRK